MLFFDSLYQSVLSSGVPHDVPPQFRDVLRSNLLQPRKQYMYTWYVHIYVFNITYPWNSTGTRASGFRALKYDPQRYLENPTLQGVPGYCWAHGFHIAGSL